jgi:hypothetical protein
MPDYKPLLRQNTFMFPEAVPNCTPSLPTNRRHAFCHFWQNLLPIVIPMFFFTLFLILIPIILLRAELRVQQGGVYLEQQD